MSHRSDNHVRNCMICGHPIANLATAPRCQSCVEWGEEQARLDAEHCERQQREGGRK